MEKSRDVANRDRRDALKKIALGTGAVTTLPILGQASAPPKTYCGGGETHAASMSAAMPAAAIGTAADAEWKPLFFDEHQNDMVIALSELIIPETDTPGAKSALVNRYMDLVLNEEESDRQKAFLEGLAWVDGRSLERHAKPFTALTAEEQTALLEPLADAANHRKEDQPGVRFFGELKDLTIFGYYTSQPGLDKELEYGGDDYHTEFPGACTHPEHQS